MCIVYFCFFATYYVLRSTVYAYTLPYPSALPGNKIYTVSRILDQLKYYWYFGSIGQVKYHMLLSDKYLVEAKTLFEYDQYLLAVDALKRSDSHYKNISHYIHRATYEGKEMGAIILSHNEQSIKHNEILQQIISSVPETFVWTPEKEASSELLLKQLLLSSIDVRKN